MKTEPYESWWTNSSYSILQCIPHLSDKKRKEEESTSQTERSKKPKCATNVRTSIDPLIVSRKNSPFVFKTNTFNDLVNALKDWYSSRDFILLQFERVDLDVDVRPLDKVFPEILHHGT